MARALSPPLITVHEALELASAHLLRPMLGLAPGAAPPPRRKADMIAEIEGLLRGDSLRRLWEALDETQQLAVREALDTPVGFFDRHHFELKYGRLPAGFEDDGGLSTATLLHFFLHAPRRHGAAPTIVPLELAQRLRAFVPPPPEAEVPAEEALGPPRVAEDDRFAHPESRRLSTALQAIPSLRDEERWFQDAARCQSLESDRRQLLEPLVDGVDLDAGGLQSRDAENGFGIRFTEDDRAGDDVAHKLDHSEAYVQRGGAPVGQLVHSPSFGHESDGFEVRPGDQRIGRLRVDQEQPLPASLTIRDVPNRGDDVCGSHADVLRSVAPSAARVPDGIASRRHGPRFTVRK